MAELIKNLGNKGLATTILALITIFLVGCLKYIPGLKNMKNKGIRKAIYQVLSMAISAGLSVAYHIFILKSGWSMDMLTFAAVISAEVHIIYPLYENLGLRALLKKILSLLVPSKAEKLNKIVDEVGVLTSEKAAKNQADAEKTGWLK